MWAGEGVGVHVFVLPFTAKSEHQSDAKSSCLPTGWKVFTMEAARESPAQDLMVGHHQSRLTADPQPALFNAMMC